MHPHRLAAGLLATVLLASGGASARASTSKAVESQLGFGVKMAKQGLWSEALFRFQEAEKLKRQLGIVEPTVEVLSNDERLADLRTFEHTVEEATGTDGAAAPARKTTPNRRQQAAMFRGRGRGRR